MLPCHFRRTLEMLCITRVHTDVSSVARRNRYAVPVEDMLYRVNTHLPTTGSPANRVRLSEAEMRCLQQPLASKLVGQSDG